MNTLSTSPCEVVVETPTEEEDTIYASDVKIPQPDGINLLIRNYELEDAVQMRGSFHSLDTSRSDHVKATSRKGIDLVNEFEHREIPKER